MQNPEPMEVRIKLATRDWTIDTSLNLPGRRVRLAEFLPFLQSLGNYAATNAETAAADAGKPVSCAKGCGACCRQFVSVSAIEAVALSKLVAAMPAVRRQEILQKFQDACLKIDASGVLQRIAGEKPGPNGLAAEYYRLAIACPFLEGEACSIHADRPLLCREYLVTSPPARCAHVFDASKPPVDEIDLEARLSPALGRALATLSGQPQVQIPLAFCLLAASRFEAQLEQTHDPLEALKIVLGEIGQFEIEAV